MTKTDLKVHVEKAQIKQTGMNPWKKVLKRTIYTDGDRFFIKWNMIGANVQINGRYYRDVMKVLGYWYLK